MKPEVKPIHIQDTEQKIYSMYLNEKSNRFVNVYKVLLLRTDYYETLNKLSSLKYGSQKADLILNSFLGKIKNTEYIASLNPKQRKDFLNISDTLLRHYYPVFVFKKFMGGKLGDYIFDPTLGFPNISFDVYPENIYQKYFYLFREKLFAETAKQNTTKKDILNLNNIIQITFDNTVKKEELLNFIDKHWNEISLVASIPNDKNRDKSSATFLRDIKIFNSYLKSPKKNAIQKELDVVKQFKAKGEFLTEFQVRNSYKAILKLHKAIN